MYGAPPHSSDGRQMPSATPFPAAFSAAPASRASSMPAPPSNFVHHGYEGYPIAGITQSGALFQAQSSPSPVEVSPSPVLRSVSAPTAPNGYLHGAYPQGTPPPVSTSTAAPSLWANPPRAAAMPNTKSLPHLEGQAGQYSVASLTPPPTSMSTGSLNQQWSTPVTPLNGARAELEPTLVPRPASFPMGPVQFSPSREERSAPPLNADFFCTDDAWNPNPRFMRPVLTKMPATGRLRTDSCLPLGLHITPIAKLDARDPQVPMLYNWQSSQSGGPPRCIRCGAWINPFVMFSACGETWTCSLCLAPNSYPKHDLCAIDGGKRRIDMNMRPEFSRCSVDYVIDPFPKRKASPADAMVRSSASQSSFGQTYSYLFMLDNSSASRLSGVWESSLTVVSEVVESLEAHANADLSFGFGFFDEGGVHIVIPPSDEMSEPSMVTVSDTEDPFAPLPVSAWARKLPPSRLHDLFDVIERLATASAEASPSGASFGFGPSLAAAYVAAGSLKVDGGRIVLVARGRPTYGFGAMRDRQSSGAYGTADEDELCKSLVSQEASLNSLSLAGKTPKGEKERMREADNRAAKAIDELVKVCNDHGPDPFPGSARVEMIVCSPYEESVESATLVHSLSQCGGHLRWLAMDFTSALGSPLETMRGRLRDEIFLASGLEPKRVGFGAAAEDFNLPGDQPNSRPATYDVARAGVMRIRASLGIEVRELVHPASAVERPGLNFGPMRSEDGIVYFPEADRGTSVYILLRHTDKLIADSYAVVQTSFLSTRLIVDPNSSSPVRRWARVLRVHTMRMKVTDSIGVLYESVDQDAFATGLVKLAARQYCREADIVATRSYINYGLVTPLLSYRKMVAAQNATTQMALPENLQLLTLYVLGALKSILFRLNDRKNSSSWASGACASSTYNERGWLSGLVLGANPTWLKMMIMPTVVKLTDWIHSDEAHPPPFLPSSATMIGDRDIILVCSGLYLFLFVGSDAEPSVVAELLMESDTGNLRLNSASHLGNKVAAFAKKLCADIPLALPWFILRQLGISRTTAPSYPGAPATSGASLSSSPMDTWVEQRFAKTLIEDRVHEGPNDKSYVEFLSLTHEHIKRKAGI